MQFRDPEYGLEVCVEDIEKLRESRDTMNIHSINKFLSSTDTVRKSPYEQIRWAANDRIPTRTSEEESRNQGKRIYPFPSSKIGT